MQSEASRRVPGCLVSVATAVGFLCATTAWGAEANTSSEAPILQEVIVTAQKREQRLQDVPVPVTALSSQVLSERNQARMEDYARMVPGFSLDTAGNGQSTLAIRGLTTGPGFTNATVGITIDDIPYGSNIGITGGPGLAPDLDPAEIQRIEVLRGPQGTLYGASSMGGLLKFVTADPSLNALKGAAQVSGSSVDGGSTGYSYRGSVDLPLITDELGIGLSAFDRHDPGFIDDPQQGRKDVNTQEVRGGRFAALWRPVEGLSLKVAALIQDTHSDGVSTVDTDAQLSIAGPLDQNRTRGTGAYDTKVRLFSAALTADLGAFDLTSLTGYGINSFASFVDMPLYAPYAQDEFNVGGAGFYNETRTKKLTQELRLSGKHGNWIEWLVGGFFTHEATDAFQSIDALDTAMGTQVGSLATFVFPEQFQEIAGFGDLTFHVTGRFDLQLGARESQNRQTYNETDRGTFSPGGLFVLPAAHSKDSSFTYLVTPSFRLTQDFMVYARVATGYRPGSPNPSAQLFDLPVVFAPDRTTNYEVGFKGDLFERRVSFDLAAYYVDWKDIQLSETDKTSGFGYVANGGKARSTGVEGSLTASPIRGMHLTATAAFTDATLREGLSNGLYGQSGDRLPFSARISGSFSADQEVPLSSALTGFAGATATYTGDRYTAFATAPPPDQIRPRMPAYTLLGLRMGVRYSRYTFTLFADNVTNERGVLSALPLNSGAASATDPFVMNLVRPRTIGLSAAASY